MLKGVLFGIINDNWATLVVFAVILIVARIFYLIVNGKEFVFYKEILSLLFIVYLLVLSTLLNKIELSKGFNIMPIANSLKIALDSSKYLKYIISNAVIFIPFGYFISAYIKAKKIGTITLASLICGLAIETVQYATINSFNIDNVIEYMIGSIIGFLLYIGLTAIKKHLPGLFQNDFLYNALCIAVVILLILYFLGVISFGWIL